MARPRKTDPRPLIRPLLEQFARDIASAVEKSTVDRVLSLIKGGAAAPSGRNGASGASRGAVRCYYPGCKNTAAPRYGMFCVALHKNLSKADKEKYRAQHAKQSG